MKLLFNPLALWQIGKDPLEEMTFDKNVFSVQSSTKDQISRKLRISITNKCNFSCFFCHNEGQTINHTTINEMSIFEIKKIVEIALKCGIREIKFTGGEPLLFKDREESIIDLISSVSELKDFYGNFDFSLITNGKLLQIFAKEMKLAGLNRVTISLNTLDNQIFHKFISKIKMIRLKKLLKELKQRVYQTYHH